MTDEVVKYGRVLRLEKRLFVKVGRIALLLPLCIISGDTETAVHTGQFVAEWLKPILNYVR